MYEVLSGPVESDSAIELAIDQLLNSNLTLRYLSRKNLTAATGPRLRTSTNLLRNG